MATTKKRTPEKKETMTQLVDDARQIAEATEEVFAKLADDGFLTAYEYDVLRLAGFSDRIDIQREVSRIGRVRRLMAEAGTNREYEAAQKALGDAEALSRTELPALEEQQRAIDARIREIQRSEALARQKLTGYQNARKALQDPSMMPAHVRRDNDLARGEAKKRWNQRISELEREIGITDKLKVEEPHLAHAKARAPELVLRDDQGFSVNESVDKDGWADYVKQRQKQRQADVVELAELVREFERAKAGKLDYYLSQIH